MKDNNAKYVVLGLLSHNPMTGYDIKKSVATRMSYFWDLSYGQIYPTLKQLEKDKLITEKTEINPKGPNRKVYTITEIGHQRTPNLANQTRKKRSPQIRIPPQTNLRRPNHTRNEPKTHRRIQSRNQKILKTMTLFEESLKPILNQSESHYHVYLTILLGKSISKASVEWADNALKMLQEHTGEEVKS